MAFVPKWYVATSRDRMFLVMNGVPYQTALDLEDGEVLRLGGEFADLAKNGWTHPCDRWWAGGGGTGGEERGRASAVVSGRGSFRAARLRRAAGRSFPESARGAGFNRRQIQLFGQGGAPGWAGACHDKQVRQRVLHPPALIVRSGQRQRFVRARSRTLSVRPSKTALTI
jgi:hypothetical protein